MTTRPPAPSPTATRRAASKRSAATAAARATRSRASAARPATSGPSLATIGARLYLAGRLTNTPDHLIEWIRHPQAVEPGNVMPDLAVTEADARDIAATLYTLR